jgi:hypothetical protein
MSTEMPSADNRLEPGHAPTPFSAEEIRAACPPGRRNVFRLEVPDEPVVVRTICFTGGDGNGAEFVVARSNADGEPIGEPQEATSGWRDFQGHASFPEAATAITTERIEIPAGAFDCWLYTVADETHGAPALLRFWFARDLPGPPVRMTHEIDGKLALTSTLIEYEAP